MCHSVKFINSLKRHAKQPKTQCETGSNARRNRLKRNAFKAKTQCVLSQKEKGTHSGTLLFQTYVEDLAGLERHVESLDAMGQGTKGDEVHASLGIGNHRVEGDAA